MKKRAILIIVNFAFLFLYIGFFVGFASSLVGKTTSCSVVEWGDVLFCAVAVALPAYMGFEIGRKI